MLEYEVKYIAKNSKAVELKSWLESRFPVDKKYPEAIISSIYFDTLDLKYMDEKLASDYIKSKFRIRWYSEIKSNKVSDTVFYEFKHKVGMHRQKKRIKLLNNKELYNESLESSKFYNILNPLRVYQGKVLDQLFPHFTISYTRKRFVIPGTDFRICIDYNINVPRFNSLFIKGSKNGFLSDCVFEIKGQSAHLPEQLLFLEKLNFKRNAFSKYDRCYQELIIS